MGFLSHTQHARHCRTLTGTAALPPFASRHPEIDEFERKWIIPMVEDAWEWARFALRDLAETTLKDLQKVSSYVAFLPMAVPDRLPVTGVSKSL